MISQIRSGLLYHNSSDSTALSVVWGKVRWIGMQFHSWIFLCVFLQVVLGMYFILQRLPDKKYASMFLIAANFVFYGYANISYFFYFAAFILLNYAIAVRLIRLRQKWLLAVGLTLDIGALAVLKYCNFFLQTLNRAFGTDVMLMHLFIPLGLSFFTFQFIALLYDCYKGTIQKLGFLDYVVFASFFPKIIQGPIMVFQDFEQQYQREENRHFSWDDTAKGFYALTIGLGKKLLIADVLAAFVNPGFAEKYLTYNSAMSLLLMLAYTLQIYYDFSAYTDMARGISLMFRISLPRNFNSPYQAHSVNDFWSRWHMSLTNFFTHYLYIPLGGNRKGEWRTYLNVMIVFAVSGLWHGADYTFVVWGLLHGLASVIEKKTKFPEKCSPVMQWLYTFTFVNVAWLFFRSETIGQALQIIRNILRCDFGGVDLSDLSQLILPEINLLLEQLQIDALFRILPIAFLVLVFLAVLQVRNTDIRMEQFRPTIGNTLMTIVVLTWSILSFGGKVTFLYEMF